VAGERSSRTRLKQVLAQRHLTVDEFRAGYQRVSGEVLSQRQAYRWVGGRLKGLPYPRAQAALERMFGEPAGRLLGRSYGAEEVIRPGATGEDRGAWQDQLVAISVDRARNFLDIAEAPNVGTDTVDQLADDVYRLATAARQQPLTLLLADIVDAQARAFKLLERRQRPQQARDLYFLAGVVSALIAKTSHDLGAAHDAMTHARAAYVCADNAGHVGLQVWTRGLQSGIAYWFGNMDHAVKYAMQGANIAGRNCGTAVARLAAGEARALAALGREPEVRAAIERAEKARKHATPDELDMFGGFFTFPWPRQLYFAADSLRWFGRHQAERTEQLALEALDAFEHAPPSERGFGDEAGTRCALAAARIDRGELDGAAEVMAPVLELPPVRRIHGIVASVEYVRHALTRTGSALPVASELGDALCGFGSDRLVPPR
jgi:hypothetical protein